MNYEMASFGFVLGSNFLEEAFKDRFKKLMAELPKKHKMTEEEKFRAVMLDLVLDTVSRSYPWSKQIREIAEVESRKGHGGFRKLGSLKKLETIDPAPIIGDRKRLCDLVGRVTLLTSVLERVSESLSAYDGKGLMVGDKAGINEEEFVSSLVDDVEYSKQCMKLSRALIDKDMTVSEILKISEILNRISEKVYDMSVAGKILEMSAELRSL